MNWLPLRRRALATAPLALLFFTGRAAAQERPVHDDNLRGEVAEAEEDTPRDNPEEAPKPGFAHRIRGSSFLFDQSLTTQTADIGTTPQSRVPLYEWWLSFRPRYWFDDHWSVWGRSDFFKELTNSQSTTDLHENVFGDVWTGLGWQTTLGARKLTKLDAGLRALFPTSKASQAAGVYLTGGLSAGVSQKIPIRKAAIASEAHAGLGLTYLHPFSRATTAVSLNDFGYVRQDVDGRSFVSDQLRGSTLVNHRLITLLDTGLKITPKLSFTLDMIFIDEWHYKPTDDVTVQTETGGAAVPRNANATTFTQSTWFLTSLDYNLVDEVSLGLGYYNLANVLAPDGERRGVFGADNIWWSPDARFFFDVTVNLDAVWSDVAERGEATKKAARDARVRQIGSRNGTGVP